MKNVILFLIILYASSAMAKQFTLNCTTNETRQDMLYRFDDVKKIVLTPSFDKVKAIFEDSEIIFEINGWVHRINRVTGSMTATSHEGTLNFTCQLANSKKF